MATDNSNQQNNSSSQHIGGGAGSVPFDSVERAIGRSQSSSPGSDSAAVSLLEVIRDSNDQITSRLDAILVENKRFGKEFTQFTKQSEDQIKYYKRKLARYTTLEEDFFRKGVEILAGMKGVLDKFPANSSIYERSKYTQPSSTPAAKTEEEERKQRAAARHREQMATDAAIRSALKAMADYSGTPIRLIDVLIGKLISLPTQAISGLKSRADSDVKAGEAEAKRRMAEQAAAQARPAQPAPSSMTDAELTEAIERSVEEAFSKPRGPQSIPYTRASLPSPSAAPGSVRSLLPPTVTPDVTWEILDAEDVPRATVQRSGYNFGYLPYPISGLLEGPGYGAPGSGSVRGLLPPPLSGSGPFFSGTAEQASARFFDDFDDVLFNYLWPQQEFFTFPNNTPVGIFLTSLFKNLTKLEDNAKPFEDWSLMDKIIAAVLAGVLAALLGKYLIDAAERIATKALDVAGEIVTQSLRVLGDVIVAGLKIAGDVIKAALEVTKFLGAKVIDGIFHVLDLTYDLAKTIIKGTLELVGKIIDKGFLLAEKVIDAAVHLGDHLIDEFGILGAQVIRAAVEIAKDFLDTAEVLGDKAINAVVTLVKDALSFAEVLGKQAIQAAVTVALAGIQMTGEVLKTLLTIAGTIAAEIIRVVFGGNPGSSGSDQSGDILSYLKNTIAVKLENIYTRLGNLTVNTKGFDLGLQTPKQAWSEDVLTGIVVRLLLPPLFRIIYEIASVVSYTRWLGDFFRSGGLRDAKNAAAEADKLMTEYVNATMVGVFDMAKSATFSAADKGMYTTAMGIAQAVNDAADKYQVVLPYYGSDPNKTNVPYRIDTTDARFKDLGQAPAPKAAKEEPKETQVIRIIPESSPFAAYPSAGWSW